MVTQGKPEGMSQMSVKMSLNLSFSYYRFESCPDCKKIKTMKESKYLIKNLGQFEKNEWSRLHDIVLSATWDTSKKLSQSELEDLFEGLPENIKEDAYRLGLNDSAVRDSIYIWIEKNNIQEHEQDLLIRYGR